MKQCMNFSKKQYTSALLIFNIDQITQNIYNPEPELSAKLGGEKEVRETKIVFLYLICELVIMFCGYH